MNTDTQKEENPAITKETSLEETLSQNTPAEQPEEENEFEESNTKKKGFHLFTPDEDKLLAEYWRRCPDNLTTEGKPHFFRCQDLSLPEIYERVVQVRTRTMKKRFDFFQRHTLHFSAIYNKLKQSSPNLAGGENPSDGALVEIAKEKYCRQTGRQFGFEPAWYVLRDHPKWMMQGMDSTLPVSSAEEPSPADHLSSTLAQTPRPAESILAATSEDSFQAEKPAPSVSPTITSSCTPGPTAQSHLSGLKCFLNRRVPNPSVPDSLQAKNLAPLPTITSCTPGPTSNQSAGSVIPNPSGPPYYTESLGTTSSLSNPINQQTDINPSHTRESSVEINSTPLSKKPRIRRSSPPQTTSVVSEPLPRSDPQSRPSRPLIEWQCVPGCPPAIPTDGFGENYSKDASSQTLPVFPTPSPAPLSEPSCTADQSHTISTVSKEADQSTNIKTSGQKRTFDGLEKDASSSNAVQLELNTNVTTCPDKDNNTLGSIVLNNASLDGHYDLLRLQLEVRRLEAENESDRMQVTIMEKDVSACTDEFEKEFFLVKKQKILANLKAE
ncbi:uncharacterized protein PGTG_16254 [Puccinia graminis f. sp. tritici CRL 75-36-700-3]|uniref:No apical meristem-associated C-terminal domain-containing protein n=1 Tax=Puccinia graminis f. sp. tritici (strain CRL 75-36-700-3 / race SCCL) TaxID=418459 RepID=E3L079_PUCGT|nr:uncharacterized protein PGTG_16254 [Puccinia graminis f. sp. tritici CRL 75-36-700-3]EFP89966.2 hypothetical protein PGTG_16254 [Puccinia graminis f. sp. tritici CRL 75-36-700-3]